MIKNREQYNIVKERQSQDVIKITLTKKVRKCGICSAMKKEEEIRVVKYPRIDKYFGRVIDERKVCDECYDDVKLILDNLKYN